jgi:hypothetical protein
MEEEVGVCRRWGSVGEGQEYGAQWLTLVDCISVHEVCGAVSMWWCVHVWDMCGCGNCGVTVGLGVCVNAVSVWAGLVCLWYG